MLQSERNEQKARDRLADSRHATAESRGAAQRENNPFRVALFYLVLGGEKVADFGVDPIAENEKIEIFENKIDVEIWAVCQEYDIEDLKSEGQGPFKAVLQTVGKRLFSGNILKDKTIYKTENMQIASNTNRYDYYVLDGLCDYYINLCFKLKKLISIEGYCYLCNISPDAVNSWKDKESSCLSFGIYKKLQSGREGCLKDKAFDSSNVVGTIAIANNEFGWSAATVRKETQAKQEALTLDALPQLQQIESNIVQIPEKTGGEKQ